MTKVINSFGKEMGAFDGLRVFDFDGKPVYLVMDDEVLARFEYGDDDLKGFNKGLWRCVGSLHENCAISEGNEVLFELV